MRSEAVRALHEQLAELKAQVAELRARIADLEADLIVARARAQAASEAAA